MPGECEVTGVLAGPAVVLTVRGEVDGGATEVLLPAYDEAVAGADRAGRHVVLDLSGVDYINSTGIALIVSVLARARAQGRTVVACGLSEHHRQIFAITRLADYLTLYPDLGRALGELGARTAPPGGS